MTKKKITKWEPDSFELEMTTHWSFPSRGSWATHDASGEETGRHIFPEMSYSDIQKKTTWYLISLPEAARRW